MRPRIALSAVLLPAPLGPISPRMRPSSTFKSTLSSATVVPKVLRRPRASMHAMVLALLTCVRRGTARFGSSEQFLRRQAEPPNGRVDRGPLLSKKLLALTLQQQMADAGVDEHAAPAPAFDELLVDQLLIGLQNRER